MLALLIAAAVAQPGRDPTLLHRDAGAVVAAKEQEQEAALRRMLELGGSPAEQAEALARLAGLLRSRGLAASIRAQAEADEGNEAAAARNRRAAGDARAEAIARYRELLGQSLRVSYEIAGREKELATSGPDAALSAQPHRDPPQVGDDEELWPFQGEYWRDELGSYRYQLVRRCKRPRTPAPTASQPSGSPPPAAVAGTPAD